MFDIGIAGVTYCLGSKTLLNSDLGKEHPNWDFKEITKRSGVISRPIAAPHETALDLGEKALSLLLQKLKISVDEIGALIFCTQTPDYLLPSNSSLLHGRLGMRTSTMSFDITHACSGFIYGVGIGKSLIMGKLTENVVLVTADTYSRLLHQNDRSTRPLFGDGAAATMITRTKGIFKIADQSFNTSGKQGDRFIIKRGGARFPKKVEHQNVDKVSNSESHINMDGMGVLSFFNSVVPKDVIGLLKKNNLSIKDIKLFIFHQASKLALEELRRNINIPPEKMLMDLEETGNLVSSSIPIALARVMKKNILEAGDLVLLSGFGVGLSWGSILIRVQPDL